MPQPAPRNYGLGSCFKPCCWGCRFGGHRVWVTRSEMDVNKDVYPTVAAWRPGWMRSHPGCEVCWYFWPPCLHDQLGFCWGHLDSDLPSGPADLPSSWSDSEPSDDVTGSCCGLLSFAKLDPPGWDLNDAKFVKLLILYCFHDAEGPKTTVGKQADGHWFKGQRGHEASQSTISSCHIQ